MNFPLDFWDLSLFFAIMAILLLATDELIFLHNGKTRILLSRKKLTSVAIMFGALFLVTLALRLILLFMTS